MKKEEENDASENSHFSTDDSPQRIQKKKNLSFKGETKEINVNKSNFFQKIIDVNHIMIVFN